MSRRVEPKEKAVQQRAALPTRAKQLDLAAVSDSIATTVLSRPTDHVCDVLADVLLADGPELMSLGGEDGCGSGGKPGSNSSSNGGGGDGTHPPPQARGFRDAGEPGRVLGTGHASTVRLTRATHTDGLRHRVAIKTIPLPPLGCDVRLEVVNRARRECEMQTAVRHPNILPMRRAVETERHVHFILEYARNGDLLHHIARRGVGGLPEAEAAVFGWQVLCAIDALHAAGIVHRDIKPENVLLDAKNNARLGDMGFARWFTAEARDSSDRSSIPWDMRTYGGRAPPHSGRVESTSSSILPGSEAARSTMSSSSASLSSSLLPAAPSRASRGLQREKRSVHPEDDGGARGNSSGGGGGGGNGGNDMDTRQDGRDVSAAAAAAASEVDFLDNDDDDGDQDAGSANFFPAPTRLPMRSPCGTATYAAPEIFLRQVYTEAVDLWSFGVFLYVCVMGRSAWARMHEPRGGPIPDQILVPRLVAGDYTPLPKDSTSPEFRHLISRLLVVDPAQRCTVAEAAEHPWFLNNIPGLAAGGGPTTSSLEHDEVEVRAIGVSNNNNGDTNTNTRMEVDAGNRGRNQTAAAGSGGGDNNVAGATAGKRDDDDNGTIGRATIDDASNNNNNNDEHCNAGNVGAAGAGFGDSAGSGAPDPLDPAVGGSRDPPSPQRNLVYDPTL
jgi:serine/threonine protein kinase